jgi:hypothetical protein
MKKKKKTYSAVATPCGIGMFIVVQVACRHCCQVALIIINKFKFLKKLTIEYWVANGSGCKEAKSEWHWSSKIAPSSFQTPNHMTLLILL